MMILKEKQRQARKFNFSRKACLSYSTYHNEYSVYQNHLSSLTICYTVSVNFLPYQAIRTVETSDFLINLIFQGRSSDHFESVQSVVSAASSKIEESILQGRNQELFQILKVSGTVGCISVIQLQNSSIIGLIISFCFFMNSESE